MRLPAFEMHRVGLVNNSSQNSRAESLANLELIARGVRWYIDISSYIDIDIIRVDCIETGSGFNGNQRKSENCSYWSVADLHSEQFAHIGDIGDIKLPRTEWLVIMWIY